MRKNAVFKVIKIKLIIDKSDKNIVPIERCHYTETVIRTCSFCVLKVGFNQVIWRWRIYNHGTVSMKRAFERWIFWLNIWNYGTFCQLIVVSKQCRSERVGRGVLGPPKKFCQVGKVFCCCYPSILTGKTPNFMLITFYTMRNVVFLVIKATP